MAIPYMGSKRKLAKPILDYICAQNPNAKYFYDLFGGGGAISFEALKRKQFEKVQYNELNTGVVELLKKIRNDGITPDFYKFVSRDEFNAHKKDPTWYGGLLATCWSFGNNQKSYLYGKEIEYKKLLYHNVCVNLCIDSLKELNNLGLNIPIKVFEVKGIQERRLFCKKFFNKRLDLQHLEQLQHLERLQHLEHLERLERLQHLEHLEHLQHLEHLEVSNLSYEEVIIDTPINETVIYCDPPYKGTRKYQKDISHNDFLDFVKSSPYKIYVSSYDFDLPCVFSMQHRSTLSAINNSKKVLENLYCNRLESPIKPLTLF